MRFALLVMMLLLVARPCFAQATLEVPVCQWGDCSKYCDPACGAGSVCGVAGRCIQTRTEEPDDSSDREAVARRHQARALTRISVGLGIGDGTVEGVIHTTPYALEAGVRQQLTSYFGISAHLGAAYARISAPVYMLGAPASRSQSSYVDFWADVIPYLGPFGRFYVGPTLAFAHRHYADAILYGDSSVTNRTRFETGGRLGLLFGNREQCNLWFQETTSLNDTTLNQALLGFSFEFM